MAKSQVFRIVTKTPPATGIEVDAVTLQVETNAVACQEGLQDGLCMRQPHQHFILGKWQSCILLL